MEFMLDTLNINEIKKWARVLPLAGVTSNPTIAKKEGEIDFFKRIHEVREIIGEAPSIHVQVVAKDYDGILKDAAKIRQECGGNVFIKVPVIKLLQPQFILYFKVFWLLKQAQITLLPIIIEWRT